MPGNPLGIGPPVDPPLPTDAVAPERPSDPVGVVRGVFDAWRTGDRPALEALLATDFRFFSPDDAGLDRDQYLEICWPHHGELTGHDFVHIGQIEPDVVAVTYEAGRRDGARWRNTEVFTVRDGRVAAVEVFFGRSRAAR